MPEVAVYAFRILDRDDKLALGLAGDDVDDYNLGRVAVLHVEHLVLADRLRGVHLGSGWSVIIPEHFFIPIDQRYAELVREEYVAVGKQHGIADLALSRGIVKLPGDLAVPHDVHVLRLGLSGVEEIMLGHTFAGQDVGEVGLGFLPPGRRDATHGAGDHHQDNEW